MDRWMDVLGRRSAAMHLSIFHRIAALSWYVTIDCCCWRLWCWRGVCYMAATVSIAVSDKVVIHDAGHLVFKEWKLLKKARERCWLFTDFLEMLLQKSFSNLSTVIPLNRELLCNSGNYVIQKSNEYLLKIMLIAAKKMYYKEKGTS